VVTAGDVTWPSEVDLVNPDQIIATIDSADGVLDMDIWVTRDRGYRPAEHAGELLRSGEIPIDAIFTPMQKVNFVVEHTRVAAMTDFDRLILEILTDGTIEPDDALAEAAQIWSTTPDVRPIHRKRRGTAAAASPYISDEVQNKPLAELGAAAARAERAAQPADRAGRPGADDGPGPAPVDPQLRSALALRAAGEAGGARVPAGGGHAGAFAMEPTWMPWRARATRSTWQAATASRRGPGMRCGSDRSPPRGRSRRR
jgi:hypothetical protein